MKWLSWLLDNAWTVIIFAGVLAQMFKAMKKKGGGDEEMPRQEEQPREYEFEDPELAERTRKIREDIQRRIQQRGRGYADEQPTVPRDETMEPPPMIREVEPPRTPVRASTRIETQRQAEILEEQAAIMERLREAEAMKLAARKRQEFEAATADHSGEMRAAARADVVGDLRSPAALRRAFILREVLGPPVALR